MRFRHVATGLRFGLASMLAGAIVSIAARVVLLVIAGGVVVRAMLDTPSVVPHGLALLGLLWIVVEELRRIHRRLTAPDFCMHVPPSLDLEPDEHGPIPLSWQLAQVQGAVEAGGPAHGVGLFWSSHLPSGFRLVAHVDGDGPSTARFLDGVEGRLLPLLAYVLHEQAAKATETAEAGGTHETHSPPENP